MGRILLTAAGSGSGKTLITCGLIEALKNKGLTVQAYKCGPDYIDPMFHKCVLGIPSENLDSFFSDEKQLKDILSRGADCDVSVIEGVMGIYDGLGGLEVDGSAYDLACKTNTPMVLILDVHGMGATMISIIKGILADDHRHMIRGIFLNRISAGYYETMKAAIEDKTGIPVIGYLRKLPEVKLESRHLGLKLPGEIENLQEQVKRVAAELNQTIQWDTFLDIAESAAILNAQETAAKPETVLVLQPGTASILGDNPVKLAVAYDEVFCFYYENNLRLLEEAGAEIVYFSPLHDAHLPEGISGLLLGGGYPELRLRELAENSTMRASIKHALQDGMPSIAECGGFMYLHQAIFDEQNIEYEMVGVIPGTCYNTGKLCRFGYIDVTMQDYHVKGHEFHYYDSSANGSDGLARKPISGKEWSFGYIDSQKIWGFPHLYYGSCEKIPRDFIKAMVAYEMKKRS